MKMLPKMALCSATMLTAFVANAFEADITVTADIDPTVSITGGDGTALPDTLPMLYKPGRGLDPIDKPIKLWSNTTDKNLTVALASSPQLTSPDATKNIPLSVSLDGKALTTTATTFEYKSTFPSGITNGSRVMPLVISQTTREAVTEQGKYSGLVSLIVAQATSPAPTPTP